MQRIEVPPVFRWEAARQRIEEMKETLEGMQAEESLAMVNELDAIIKEKYAEARAIVSEDRVENEERENSPKCIRRRRLSGQTKLLTFEEYLDLYAPRRQDGMEAARKLAEEGQLVFGEQQLQITDAEAFRSCAGL